MKNELLSAVAVCILGIVAAYFITNMIVEMRTPGDFSFNTVDPSTGDNVSAPDPEVFNYKALNPTVEVYVGDCQEFNQYGECIDENGQVIEENIIEQTEESDSTSTSGSTSDSTNQRTP